MPQMMPLNWMMLLLYFIFIFFILNILIYYIFNNKETSIMKNKYKINWIWKW
uniref:ATP synthase complex subunit 8 n=1 Tax=Coleoptera sp. ACP-2013 TaxID=2485033 RepID=A0A3G3ME77_9COLE|nr:ATP synthase F0 subunit 8 [Coleoptera sp. ACP-2013]